MSVTVKGGKAVMVNTTPTTNVDATFEPLQFPNIYNGDGTVSVGNILNHDWKIIRPNISFSIAQDSFFNLNNSTNGASGQIQVTYVAGTEKLRINGILVYFDLGAPGVLTINYLNTGGILTLS
jgi:hypothetical protein